MLSLQTKSNLTPSENLFICSAIQTILLDEIFKATQWKDGDAIFHGGTSLKYAWGSPRFSEDLDFMVPPSRLDKMDGIPDAVGKRVNLRMAILTPGCSIAVKSSMSKPGQDRMNTWDFRWSHPMRHGIAKVKCEFYSVSPELLAPYRRTSRTPHIENGGITMSASIPMAELISLWGDKVKAVATRPQFKMRDAHDLGFLSKQFEILGNRPHEKELIAAIETAANIYGKTLEDVVQGVENRLQDGTFERLDDFQSDMARWFDESGFRTMLGRNDFEDYWNRAREELVNAVHILSPAPTKIGMRP